MKDEFVTYHPFTVFFYFLIVGILTFLIRNTTFIILGMVIATISRTYVFGRRALQSSLFWILVVLLFACAYAAFDTRGSIVLFSYLSDRPFTLEAFARGLTIGGVAYIIIVYFSIFNRYLTIEKFLYMFSGIMPPSSSVVLSLIFRFVPRYQDRAHHLVETRQCMGLGARSGSLFRKIIVLPETIGTMSKWVSLGPDKPALAMRSRGYGLAKRTTFTNYEFKPRDLVAVIVVVVFSIFIIFWIAMGGNTIGFSLISNSDSASRQTIIAALSYAALLVVPLAINLRRWISWRAYVSKI